MNAELHPELSSLAEYIRAVRTGWLDLERSKPATIIVRDLSFVASDEREGGELITMSEGVIPVMVPGVKVRSGLRPLPIRVRAVVRLGRVVSILTDPRSQP